MKIKWSIASLLAIITLSGCTTTAEFVNQNQPAATSAAQSRGAFELSCHEVSATTLNTKTIDLYEKQIPEYQIGVSGCGKKQVYTVICNPDSGCMAYEDMDGALDAASSSADASTQQIEQTEEMY